MKIRFEATMEDVIAFQRFHFANSPAWRRQVWKQMLLVPGIVAFLLLVAYLMFDRDEDENWIFGMGAGLLLAISIPWAFFIRWRLYSALGNASRRYLAEGSNRTMFGWREMELVNNRLVLKAELIESSLDLRGVEKIVSDGNYTYVYIGSTTAHIIPMRLYPEDEYREFVADLREAWDARDAPRPIEQIPSADARIMEKPL